MGLRCWTIAYSVESVSMDGTRTDEGMEHLFIRVEAQRRGLQRGTECRERVLRSRHSLSPTQHSKRTRQTSTPPSSSVVTTAQLYHRHQPRRPHSSFSSPVEHIARVFRNHNRHILVLSLRQNRARPPRFDLQKWRNKSPSRSS